MWTALKKGLSSPNCPQWARYLRHKGLRAPAVAGHKWRPNPEHTRDTTGVLLELPAARAKRDRLCDKEVEQHHGYFTLKGPAEKNYFYWLFESRTAPKHPNTPLILWLTGGPGCSSEVALFTENGPCSVNADGATTKSNPYAWNKNAHLVFVDQPAGTGFSYGEHTLHLFTIVSIASNGFR